MCAAYEAESRFIRGIEFRHPKCEVCNQNSFWHNWTCEGHPDFQKYYESALFDPKRVIWKKRPL